MNAPNLAENKTAPKKCEIWAIGGGKGGTGKSFLTSNMGSCLADMGRRVILIDADLGGANLHSFLGIRRSAHSLCDFFERRLPLNEIIDFPGNGSGKIGLITGNIHSLETDNIKYVQRQKLLRHIRTMDADHVLIDLGAGCHFTSIDTFLCADRMIVVIVPEITSIENMYQFVKSALFRKIGYTFAEHDLRGLFQHAWKERRELGISNLKGFLEYLARESGEAKHLITEVMSHFVIDIVVNQARTADDVNMGNSVKSVFKKYFGLNSNYLGHIDYDDSAWACVRQSKPVIHAAPSSRSALAIKRLTESMAGRRQETP